MAKSWAEHKKFQEEKYNTDSNALDGPEFEMPDWYYEEKKKDE